MQGIHQFPSHPVQDHTTTLQDHTTSPDTTLPHATLLPAATPISISSSPNLGLEPNPQTLTSVQSLIVSSAGIQIFDKSDGKDIQQICSHLNL